MNKDMIKTAGAIVLIAAIVVATFLYGNQQRQVQLRHDQEAKQQQEQKANEQTASQPTISTDTPVNTPTLTTPGTTTPAASTPDTGGEIAYLLPLAAVAGMYRASRRSRQRLNDAIRTA